MTTFVTHVLASIVVSAAMLGIYDRTIAKPARTMAVVDTVAVFRMEEERLTDLLAKDGSPEQRARIANRARRFASDFPQALEQITIDCGCVVVERSALVGTPPHVTDLTPQLKRRMQQ